MMFNKKIPQTINFIFMLFVFSGLHNAYSANSSWYAGVNVGTGDVDFSGYDDSDTLSLYVGNKISNQMSVEFGYTDLGEFKVTGAPGFEVDVDGLEVTAVGKMSTGNTVEVFGKIGMYMWDVEGLIFGLPAGSDSGTSITFGLGVDVHFNPNFGGRIAFQHYGDVSDADITNISLGIFSSF